MSSLRRSSRSRQKATSIYDEAQVELDDQEDKLQKNADENEDDNDDDDTSATTDSENEANGPNSTDEENEDSDDDDDDDADDDDDFQRKPTKKKTISPSPRKKTPTKKTPTKASSTRKSGPKKVQVKLRTSPKRRRAGSGSAVPPGQRPINTALNTLARKVLDKSEIGDKGSLVAALITSYQSGAGVAADWNEDSSSQPRTVYTPQLTTVAKRVIALHNNDPNAAQIQLLNLLFRSVGGTVETNLDPEELQLEEMVNEDWGPIVTDLVDEMRHTPADCILICSDPLGAVHAAAMEDEAAKNNRVSSRDVPVTASSLGVRTYRTIYEEFWYILGAVALTEGSMSTASRQEDPIDNSSDEDEPLAKTIKRTTPTKNTSFTTTTRLDTELVRDLLTRMTGLVSVGQPDVRAAATAAAMGMAHAIIDKTVVLGDKLTIVNRQFAAATVGAKGKGKKKLSVKAESLKHQIDSLKRMQADLEAIILASVIQGVFVHRYRDTNMFIRSSCLDALARMTIRRPDMFLSDKFLKYHGWMMSDKEEGVRVSALKGLLLPFEAATATEKSTINIDISLMEHVIVKFLPRIADSIIDVNVTVQERGMKLLLALLRTGLLDDIEDENIWNQINLCALANDTSSEVRRDALYFIMEQLEAFDEEDDASDPTNTSTAKKEEKPSDRRATQRLDAIASWAAHALTDGQVPIEKIQIKLVNHLVVSLRGMPDHKEIITNWSAMLRAIQDDNVALTSQGTVAGDRADAAKQRVLVQMLAYAAKAEVGSVTDSTDADPDIVDASEKMELSMVKGGKRSKKKANDAKLDGLQHETFSVALIKALPNLLAKFKADPAILESLTSLPRYLIPTVFSLPQRKSNFLDLSKSLTDIFLQSTDEQVMQNTACSMIYLCNGDHARLAEAKVAIREALTSLHERIVTNLMEKTQETKEDNVSIDDEMHDSSQPSSKEVDAEHALYLNLKRMRVISKRMNVSEYITNDEDNVNPLEKLCNSIGDGIARRLAGRKLTQDDTEDTWVEKDTKYPSVVAGVVHEGLQFILVTLAWTLSPIFEREALTTHDKNSSVSQTKNKDKALKSFILSLRNRLLSLVELCFEQFLPEVEDENAYSPAQVIWSDLVQQSGGRAASDLRTLLHRELADSSCLFLRELSITDDSRLIGGFVRYFRSKEKEKLRCNEHVDEEDADAALTLLLPLCRSLATNWKVGNRREAGVALAHITGSGSEASQVVTALSRLLKKVEPVRLLEAHMASLRQSYEDWINNDPEELENDHPTDEEMAAFSEAEQSHEKLFQDLANQAHRFSMSLGVNKLSDKKLSPALLGFIREGVRFSFSASDDLVIGSRLSFLSVLSKYAHWMKKSPEHRHNLSQDLYEKESSLKDDVEFDEVHEDDLAALADFRESLGLKVSDVLIPSSSVSEALSTQFSNAMTPNSYAETHDDEESRDSVSESLQSSRVDQTPTPSTRRNSSIGINSNISSIGSVRSLISTRSSLFPLVEEDVQNDDESSQSPNQTMGSRGSPLSRNQTVNNDEESFQSHSQSEQSGGSRSQTVHNEDESLMSRSQTVGSEESSQLHSHTVHNENESPLSRSQLVQDYEDSPQTLSETDKSKKRHISDTQSTYHRSQTTFDGEMSINSGDTESNLGSLGRKKTRSS